MGAGTSRFWSRPAGLADVRGAFPGQEPQLARGADVGGARGPRVCGDRGRRAGGLGRGQGTKAWLPGAHRLGTAPRR